MGEVTKIQWCHHTLNPWIGCARVSPGCEHCYAETQANFRKAWGVTWGVHGNRKITSDANWALPHRWNRAAIEAGERRRVFCASLADVFEDRPELVGPRERLCRLIEETQQLDWLLLTKRPENMRRLASLRWRAAWPRNVWAGCTAEDQKRADERVPSLLGVPAAVHFVSYEPALEAVDFSHLLDGYEFVVDGLTGVRRHHSDGPTNVHRGKALDWIIVGGESGHGARPFDLAWVRRVLAQCQAAGVACFVKQFGARPFDSEGPIVGGARITEISLVDRKGGNIAEWSTDLMVREFPEVRA